MTTRQIMRKIFRGEVTDSLPFAPRLDLWYAAKKFTGNLPDPHKKANLEEICRSEGWGIYRLHPDFNDFRDRKYDWPWAALGIYIAKETLYDVTLTSQVEMTTQYNCGKMLVKFDTAKGALSSELELTDSMSSMGITFPHIIKKIASGVNDFEKLALIFENLVLIPNTERYNRSVNEIGEDGLVASWAVEIASPMNLIQRYLMEIVDFFYLYVDDYIALERLSESVSNYYNQVIKIYESNEVEVVAWGGNFDDAITYPPFFKKEIVPWIQKVTTALHDKGKIVISHTDGENRKLLDLIKNSGIDGAESFSPYPQTKVTFKDYYENWADRLILIGGIPTDYFIRSSATTGELVSYLNQVQTIVSPTGRYIPGITDGFSPLGDFDRLRIAGDFFQNNSRFP
jgi:hypothetical protein